MSHPPLTCRTPRSPSQSLAHDRGLTLYYERVLRDRDATDDEEARGNGWGRARVGTATAGAAHWSSMITEDQLSDAEGERPVSPLGSSGSGSKDRSSSSASGNSPVAR